METARLINNQSQHNLFASMPSGRHSNHQSACASNAALRLADLFFDLLEKQFLTRSPNSKMKCRYPVDFAAALSVHINHLNRCLKDITGKTTSQLIADRIVLEAGILLHDSKWNVCEIGYCFGFEESPHFINFFKKNVKMSPSAYRRMTRSEFSDTNTISIAGRC